MEIENLKDKILQLLDLGNMTQESLALTLEVPPAIVGECLALLLEDGRVTLRTTNFTEWAWALETRAFRRDFHGTYLVLPDYLAMEALERELGHPIPCVQDDNDLIHPPSESTPTHCPRDPPPSRSSTPAENNMVRLYPNDPYNCYAEEFYCCIFGYQEFDGRVRGLSLKGLGLTALPAAVGRLTALEELLLCGNDLTNLPDFLGTLPHLGTIQVGMNPVVMLPATLKHAPNLRVLDIGCTPFQRLPEFLTELPPTVRLIIPRALLSDPVVAVLDARGVEVEAFGADYEAWEDEGGLDARDLHQVEDDYKG